MTKRDDIIKTSFEMFCKDGFAETGVDEIALKSGVSKMTMYYYFKSKDDLIMAVLKEAHDLFVKNVIDEVNKAKVSADKKIVRLFSKLWNLTKEQELVRCVFINATAEFADIKNPIHQYAIKHKRTMEVFVLRLLKKEGYKDARHIARVVTALSQGALVMAQISNDRRYYLDARFAIEKLLKN